jgi:hypothetical protein
MNTFHLYNCGYECCNYAIVIMNAYEVRIHSYSFVFIRIHSYSQLRNFRGLISSCRRDKMLHLCNCIYECCNYAITQLRNYAIVNTNEYECIQSKHKFVFICNDNCLISSCRRDKMRRNFRGLISSCRRDKMRRNCVIAEA